MKLFNFAFQIQMIIYLLGLAPHAERDEQHDGVLVLLAPHAHDLLRGGELEVAQVGLQLGTLRLRKNNWIWSVQC